MRSTHDTTSVNVGPPRRSSSGPLIAAAIAALALIGIVATAALGPRQATPSAVGSPTPSPTPTEAAETVAGATATPQPTAAATTTAQATSAPSTGDSQTYESPLGYSVELPSGWRRSELRSHDEPVPNGNPDSVASDRFTIRSPEDEREAMARSVNITGPAPVDYYTAAVTIDRNSEKKTTREFAEDVSRGTGHRVESIEDVKLGGREAIRVTYEEVNIGTSYTYFVQDDQGRIWMIGFMLGYEVPEGATREDLVKIVESFDADWLHS